VPPSLFRTAGLPRHIWAFIIAGVFSFLACAISMWHMRNHLACNENAQLRKYTIRILMMVPIYAVCSFLGLVDQDVTIYMDVLRDCYESYTIYSFFMLMITFLGGPQLAPSLSANKVGTQSHMFPFQYCLKTWVMGPEFFRKTRLCVLQYVVLKTACAFLTFILAHADVYGDGEFRLDRGYIYISLIANTSQLVAMYCLVLFYHAFVEELAQVRPLPKLLSIKLLVFATFWQSVVVAACVHIHLYAARPPSSSPCCAKSCLSYSIIFSFLVVCLFCPTPSAPSAPSSSSAGSTPPKPIPPNTLPQVRNLSRVLTTLIG
jgi:hypothetical protein